MEHLVAKYRALVALVMVAFCAAAGCNTRSQNVNAGVAAALAEAKAAGPKPYSIVDPSRPKFGATGDNPAGWIIDPTTGALKAPSGKVIEGVSYKPSATVVSTSNQASLSGFAVTIDTVLLNSANQTVWLFGQTTTTQDGCYHPNASTWTRCTEASAGDDVAGAYFAAGGSANKGVWLVTNASGAGVVGTNDLAATNLSSGGGGGQSFPPTGDLAMASHGFTGMRAGTTTGEGVTYEQISSYILKQANGAFRYDTLVDDFDTAGSASTGAAIIVNGSTFGRAGWRAGYSGTGSAAVTMVTTGQDANHHGVVQLDTGTIATNVSTIFRGSAGTLATTTFASGQTFTQSWDVFLPALSDGTNTYSFRVGWADSATAPANGAYVEYLQTTSANWRCISNASSTPTVGTGGTSTPVAAAQWIKLTVTWDGTNVSCAVNGVSIGSAAATPGAGSEFAGIVKTVGTSSGVARIDLFDQAKLWSSNRG